MIRHIDISKTDLRSKIEKGEITFGGYAKEKIYGTLSCRSGKRMKRESRVFFASEAEAIAQGFRPCGFCLRKDYQSWKNARASSAFEESISTGYPLEDQSKQSTNRK